MTETMMKDSSRKKVGSMRTRVEVPSLQSLRLQISRAMKAAAAGKRRRDTG